MNNIQWIESVVGKPWVDRASGPDSFDCWGLVIDKFKRVDNIDLDPVSGYESGDPIELAGPAEALLWTETDSGQDGCVFAVYSESGDMIHVGLVMMIYKAGIYAVHAAGKNGIGQVVAEPLHHVVKRYTRLKCSVTFHAKG